MKLMRKRFGILLVTTLILACFINLPVKAAEDEGSTDGAYRYTVRIFAGKQGTINGEPMVKYDNVEPNTKPDFNFNEVSVNDGSKYYAKGILESGKAGKTNSIYINSIPAVKGDIDYVVAYGLRSNMVKYTVYYIDNESGADLAAPQTFYGSVGDKPVVAYLYIEGYQPLSYNLTKTLQADESENVFTFRYTSLTGAVIDETMTVLSGTGQTAAGVVPGEAGEAGENAVTVVDADGDVVPAPAPAGGGADGVALPEPEVPLDTIDLDTMTDEGVAIDEPTVPLADMKLKLGPIEVDARRLVITFVILAAAAAIAAASFWYWRPRRKKEKNDEEDVARPV